PPAPSSLSSPGPLRASGRMRASSKVRGTWWLRGDKPRPVVEGVFFDDLEFVPDSDDEGAANEFISQGCDDELVPETQLHVTTEEIGIGHTVTTKTGGQRRLGSRPRLGTMLHEWRRIVSDYEKPSIDMTSIEKAWADEKKAIAHVETDSKGNTSSLVNRSTEKKAYAIVFDEGKSISDAETDDEGVNVRGQSQMKDLHDIMFPTYTQVCKRRRI
ncbi:uncharacterized protein LOC121053479, partial [Oryza brachyantha]|uniref:uncharacterized protein LOC121053479 n=1 Tax=Oryza brachyantha TaxID=4533 RepID=UPI001ADD2265